MTNIYYEDRKEEVCNDTNDVNVTNSNDGNDPVCNEIISEVYRYANYAYTIHMSVFVSVIVVLFLIICMYIYFWAMVNSYRRSISAPRIQNVPQSEQMSRQQRPIFVIPLMPPGGRYLNQHAQHYPNYYNQNIYCDENMAPQPVQPSQIPPPIQSYRVPNY